MPIVTLTVRQGCPADVRDSVLNAVHAALVDAGVHERDRFQRVLELPASDFRFDPTFPDVSTSRTDRFVLVEVLLGVGRSVKVKKAVLAGIVRRVAADGLDPENLMVVFQDVPWENWSPAGGRMPHG
jgi:phenylpyruvate tautomerase PptA (4-oxalocrotonate tautomerase family)